MAGSVIYCYLLHPPDSGLIPPCAPHRPTLPPTDHGRGLVGLLPSGPPPDQGQRPLYLGLNGETRREWLEAYRLSQDPELAKDLARLDAKP